MKKKDKNPETPVTEEEAPQSAEQPQNTGETAGEQKKLNELRSERAKILTDMKLTEDMLVPQYRCKKCNDTGFDANGNVCDCYKKFVEDVNSEKKLENILDVYSNIEI